MTKIQDIEKATKEFFARHWYNAENIEPMVWKYGWRWEGSVPYHDKGGVYALLDEMGEVIYIGLGASIGNPTYPEHGISRRLLAHVLVADKDKGRGYYKPHENWLEVRDIAAVGFPKEYAYLAPALEDFLIRKFSPIRNQTKKERVSKT